MKNGLCHRAHILQIPIGHPDCSKELYKIWIFSCFVCAVKRRSCRIHVCVCMTLNATGERLVSPQVSVLLLKINRMYRSISLIIAECSLYDFHSGLIVGHYRHSPISHRILRTVNTVSHCAGTFIN